MLGIFFVIITTLGPQDFSFTCYCETCPISVEVDFGAGEGKLEKTLEECEKVLKIRHTFTRRVPRSIKAKFKDVDGNEYEDRLNIYFR